MSKVLAIFGATGQQGGSVLNYVLNDAHLSSQYSIRAITSDVTSGKAQALKQKKVDVVQGNMSDAASLKHALSGAHTAFIMTNPDFTDGVAEYETGKRVADAAVDAGVQYLIFASLPPAKEVSHGKYTKVFHFDAKHRVEQYIKSLPIKSAIVIPGGYMEIFTSYPFAAPHKVDGEWVLELNAPPNAELALIDVVADFGKFVGVILKKPDELEGKTLHAAVRNYTLEEIVQMMTASSGKKVSYKQITAAEFKQRLPGQSDILFEAFSYSTEYGLYGPDGATLTADSVKLVDGRLNSYEDYLKAHPLKLE